MRTPLLAFLLFALGHLFAQQTTYTIDFNNYNAGNLNNQDGWKTFKEWNGTTDFKVTDALDFASFDGTQAIHHNAGGPGVGRVATRKATPNFNFSFQNGGLRTFEYDVHGCWWGTWACIGFDKNNNGRMTPNQANIEPDEGGLIISTSGFDFPNSSKIVLPNGTSYNFTMAQATNDRWARVRVTIDLDANGGGGSVSLSMKEDLLSGGDWSPMSGAQGLNLKLTPGSGDKNDPNKWDAISFQVQGGTGAFDNISISQPSASYQYISFTAISDHLTTDQPFQVSASASSGLPIAYSIVSGPATVNGNTVTLTGPKGVVTVRASQAGGSGFDPAVDVESSFEVVDAAEFPPALDIRTPVNGAQVAIPAGLSPMLLSAYSSVQHTDLLSVQKVEFILGNETITAQNHENGHFTAWWTPASYGPFSMSVKSYNSEGFTTAKASDFEVVNSASNLAQTTFDKTHLSVSNGTKDTFYVLPAHVGAYDQIIGKLKISCPSGGCDPWDRVSSIKVKSHEGTWVEIIRYITPYGVPCSHEIDLTDFFPILQGKAEMRAELGTFANGFEYTLDLEYRAGSPAHKYGTVNVLWKGDYHFGDMANLQPAETYKLQYPANALTSTLKLVSTGHSWGDNNTGNAAEFHEDTHHIRVNGANAFDQHNWWDCNPNPQGCQPQNGTWYFDRAGWCPGTIAQWFNFNMTPHINTNSPIELRYIFDENYVDLCSPNNPGCVSGVTCPDCADAGANPILAVWANLITYSDGPNQGITGIKDLANLSQNAVLVLPNPSDGRFQLYFQENIPSGQLRVLNTAGQLVLEREFPPLVIGDRQDLDLGAVPSGVYFLSIRTTKGNLMKQLVVR
jgi:hypothetical protein